LTSGLWIILAWLKFDHQRVFDGEYRIVIEILAIFVEDLRRDGFVAFDENLERS